MGDSLSYLDNLLTKRIRRKLHKIIFSLEIHLGKYINLYSFERSLFTCEQ